MTKPPRFLVIDGTPQPDAPKERRRKRMLAHPELPTSVLRCTTCTGSAMIELRLGVELYAGKPRGGQKRLYCAQCFSQGVLRLIL